ncbi:hypothetical protein ACSBR2_031031 [Camellia fascicularis]
MEILNMCPSMYRKVNSRGDTPLHIAAREGHSTIVRALIEYANALDEELKNRVGTTKDMMRMSNEAKDTALHGAMRNHHTIVVQLLTQEDPEVCHPAKNAEETPLYLAAEGGYVGLVFVILETCTVLAYGGPGGRTALHSAVIHNLEGCTRKLLQWKPALSKEADAYRWTPLHYAACFGYVLRARELLDADKSVAYIADKDGKNIILHLTASQGHIFIIEELISHYIDGNTSLHLLAASDCYEAGLVKHPMADMIAFNDASLTPLHVLCSKSVEPWHHTIPGYTSDVDSFTVPGGYDARQGFDHGTTILARTATFKAFVIADFMAMIFSTTAMLIYFVVAGGLDRDKLLKHYASAYYLIVIVVGAMVLAFITGMYAVLAHSLGLAIALCVIGCLSFPVNYFLLRKAWCELRNS